MYEITIQPGKRAQFILEILTKSVVPGGRMDWGPLEGVVDGRTAMEGGLRIVVHSDDAKDIEVLQDWLQAHVPAELE